MLFLLLQHMYISSTKFSRGVVKYLFPKFVEKERKRERKLKRKFHSLSFSSLSRSTVTITEITTLITSFLSSQQFVKPQPAAAKKLMFQQHTTLFAMRTQSNPIILLIIIFRIRTHMFCFVFLFFVF